jgi:hypothetical protein
VCYLHVAPRIGEADLDVVLPMRRLAELAAAGVGRRPAADPLLQHGCILEPTGLVETTSPTPLDAMRAEHVAAAVWS